MQNEIKCSRPLWSNAFKRDKSLFWLDKNEITLNESLEFNKYIIKQIEPLNLAVYPDLGETYKLLEDIFDIDEGHTLLVNGADGGIRESFLNIHDNHKVFILEPTFAMISVYPMNMNLDFETISYKLNDNQLTFDFEELIRKISSSDKPPFLIIASPDSPTGNVLSMQKFKTLEKLIAKKNGFFLFDATYGLYEGFENLKEIIKLIKISSCSLLTTSLSKSPGLAGTRLGFITGSIDNLNKIRAKRPMYEIGALQASILNNVLLNWDSCLKIISQINSNKKELESLLKKNTDCVLNTGGNFTLFKSNDELDSALSKICYFRNQFNSECLNEFSRLSTPPAEFIRELKKMINK